MRILKRVRAIFILTLFIILFSSFFYFFSLLNPIDENDKSNSLFYVAQGSSLNLVLHNLEKEKFIKSYYIAKIYSYLNKDKLKLIKPGEYKLSKSMSIKEILGVISSGKVFINFITIREGLSINKISKLLDEKNYSGQKYLNLATNISPELREKFVFLDKLPNGSSFEGYLFPDTYDITKGNIEDLIKLQLSQFEKTIYQAWFNRSSNWKLSFQETLTLASIVELEAQVPQERDIIAGVFMKRLEKGMTLGSDPTVEYALGWHQNENGLSYDDIKVRSPYNTYINVGLPPGPICNPGLATFNAVLNYKNTPYLYFVAKGDGSHIFTSTYKDHLNAQARIKNGLVN